MIETIEKKKIFNFIIINALLSPVSNYPFDLHWNS